MRVAKSIVLPYLLLCALVAPGLVRNASGVGVDGSDQGPAQLLESKGLRKQGSAYVLAGETELTKLAKEVPALQRTVFEAAKAFAQSEQLDAARKEEIDQCTQQHAALATQLAGAATVQEHNKIILQSNALAARLIQLHKATDVEKNLDEARQRTASAREAFVDNVLKSRVLADQVQKDYEALQADSAVTKALAELNAESPKKMTLGPTPNYKRNVTALKKLEATVLSESIKLRREGKTYYVNVVVVGKPPKEFVVDSGATTVSIPWQLAAELSLTPDASAPKVRCSLADGRVVNAHRVVAKNMRVGKFAAENVDCLVMPADLDDAPPLLGMSFLGNYSFRIDPQAATMTLTKVEVPGAQRGKAKKSAK